MDFPDWHSCHHCRGRFLSGPRRPANQVDASPTVPEGHSIAFHLCHECVRSLNARRSDLWGWIYKTR